MSYFIEHLGDEYVLHTRKYEDRNIEFCKKHDKWITDLFHRPYLEPASAILNMLRRLLGKTRNLDDSILGPVVKGKSVTLTLKSSVYSWLVAIHKTQSGLAIFHHYENSCNISRKTVLKYFAMVMTYIEMINNAMPHASNEFVTLLKSQSLESFADFSKERIASEVNKGHIDPSISNSDKFSLQKNSEIVWRALVTLKVWCCAQRNTSCELGVMSHPPKVPLLKPPPKLPPKAAKLTPKAAKLIKECIAEGGPTFSPKRPQKWLGTTSKVLFMRQQTAERTETPLSNKRKSMLKVVNDEDSPKRPKDKEVDNNQCHTPQHPNGCFKARLVHILDPKCKGIVQVSDLLNTASQEEKNELLETMVRVIPEDDYVSEYFRTKLA